MNFRNWAGTIQWTPKALYAPKTLEEIKNIINNNNSILIVGSKHSYSDILKGKDNITVVMSLKNYKGVEFYKEINGKNIYSVKAGTDVNSLIKFLKRRNETLQNMGTTTFQTIAGLISTNTHGTGNAYGGFCDQVYSYDIIDTDGIYHENISKDNKPELFFAIGAGIGAVGVVTTVRIYVEKITNLRSISNMVEQSELIKDFLGNTKEYNHVQAYWFPYNKKAYLLKRKETMDTINTNKISKSISNFFLSIVSNYIYPNLLKLIKGGSNFNKIITRLLSFLFYRLLPNEDFIDDKPSSLVESFTRNPWENLNEGEIITTTDNFDSIISELSQFFLDNLKSSEIFLEFPVHIRTVKYDKNYLSPFYSDEERVFIALGFPNIPNEPEDIYKGIVAIFDKFNGTALTRFHLGKNIPLNISAESIHQRYPMIKKWKEVYNQFNKKKILTNEFVVKYLN